MPPFSPACKRLLREWRWVLFALALAAILGIAAAERFRLPQTPLMDNDTWGYLGPGFSKLLGRPFGHIHGRNFLYPAFVYTVLKTCGDYRAICVWQHAIGVLTGVVVAVAWIVLCELLAATGRVRWWARFFGLLLVAEFLWSQSPLMFEHTIRPEGVFPFFLATSFLLNLCALHAGYVAPRPAVERWCLGLNFFGVAVLQSLKPSVGFAVAAANLPLAVWLVRRNVPWRGKLAVAVTALLVTGLTLWLPEQRLKTNDRVAVTFLPNNLFLIHAEPIETQIADDLRTGGSRYNATWLRQFNAVFTRELAESRQPANHPWHSFGFNPDYLLFEEPVFADFFHADEGREEAQFCSYYYQRTWLHQPGAMLVKIVRQLQMVYPLLGNTELGRALKVDPQRKHWIRRFFVQRLSVVAHKRVERALAQDYQEAWVTCQRPLFQARLSESPRGQQALAQIEALQRTKVTTVEAGWVYYLNDLLNQTRLLFAVAGLLAGIICWRRQRAKSAPLLGAVGLLFGVNFGMFLTVSVVHTLEVPRYVETQLLCTLWGAFATVLLIGQAVAQFRGLPMDGGGDPTPNEHGEGISLSETLRRT